VAQKGARKVLGIEIDREYVAYANSRLKNDYGELSEIVEFKVDEDLEKDKFDVVISKDCFEHYDDPENFILTMKEYLKPDGIMVIGFSPLWKSPYGSHTSYLTPLPWAHLIFPKSMFDDELKRLIPTIDVCALENYLNKMTLRRYRDIVRRSGLEFRSLRVNVSTRILTRIVLSLFNIVRLIPFLHDYFTVNVYSILQYSNAERAFLVGAREY